MMPACSKSAAWPSTFDAKTSVTPSAVRAKGVIAGSARVHDDRAQRCIDQSDRCADGTEDTGIQRHRREDRLAGGLLEFGTRRLGLARISTGEVDGVEAAGFGELPSDLFTDAGVGAGDQH